MSEQVLISVPVAPDTSAPLQKHLHRWKVRAIKDGIKAADRGATVSFEKVKKALLKGMKTLYRQSQSERGII